jgi:hypothetical protein
VSAYSSTSNPKAAGLLKFMAVPPSARGMFFERLVEPSSYLKLGCRAHQISIASARACAQTVSISRWTGGEMRGSTRSTASSIRPFNALEAA